MPALIAAVSRNEPVRRAELFMRATGSVASGAFDSAASNENQALFRNREVFLFELEAYTTGRLVSAVTYRAAPPA